MAARRRKKARSTSRPAATVVAGPGERLWVLDVPYELRQMVSYAGGQWDPVRRVHVFCGRALPAALRPFLPAPLSWSAWQAAEVQGTGWPQFDGDGSIQLRPHQVAARDLAVQNFSLGRPGFLLADEVGLGKTFSTIAAVNAMPASVQDVLVVSPLSVTAAWRQSLRTFGTGDKRWCVTNIDGLKKLLSVPKSAKDAKKTKTRNKHIAESGQPLVDWDVVVFDESHLLRNPAAQRTKASRTLSKHAFRFWLSATAGQNPLELSYLAELLGESTGRPVQNLEEFEAWCEAEGISVRRGAYGKWEWDGGDEDLEAIRGMLFGPVGQSSIPMGLRRRPTDVAGWPEQQRVAHPVELSGAQRVEYDEAWTEFRKARKLEASGKDPSNGMVVRMRFRQKASLIRVPGTVELVRSMLDNGRQVALSVKWLESLDELVEQLEKAKVPVACIHGQMSADEREQERQRYQRGDAKVMVFTVLEGINLQATETGANGAPRVTVVHDVRYSGIKSLQVEGRSQRDGARADTYYVYAESTAEQDVVERAVSRMKSTKQMAGDDAQQIRELEELLDGAVSDG